MRAPSKVEVTLAVGIALLAGAVAATLTRSPPRVVRKVAQGEGAELGITIGDIAICQAGEVLPGGVSGVRFSMRAFYGARMRVTAYSGSRVLTEGSRGPNWTGRSVTVPIAPVASTTSGVRLCFAIGPNSEPVTLVGDLAHAREAAVVLRGDSPTATGAGRSLGGKVGVEYLAAGDGSWWSRLLPVARRLGLGRAFSGTWIALLVAALTAAAGALAVALTLRELP